MTYLLKRNGHYYYNRAVPLIFRSLDPRNNIRVSLKTDSRRQAWRKAIVLNDEVEAYWQSLAKENQVHDDRRFAATVLVARQMGFTYQPLAAVAALPLEELVARVLALQDAMPKQVEAALGGKEQPVFSIRQTLDKFWELTKDQVINKTPDQLRKWRNPRLKAVENFIAVVGNKVLKDITRDDIVAFKDWWLERISNDNKNPESANKDFIHLKGVLETVSEHFKVGLDIQHLFKKILLKKRFKQTRLPFTSDQIRGIFKSNSLGRLNPDIKACLMVAAETGARPSEIVGLLPQDIHLDAPIPYIHITDRKERALKTPQSDRQIPLVGYALQALKEFPKGFPQYRDQPDNLTNKANRFLRENGLLPSKQHTMYSFRHSFQDRILRVNAPDRVQAELMGHKFQRPQYGDGAGLEQKKDWLDKICIKRCEDENFT